MKKKLLALTLALALSAGLLAGCAPKEEEPAGESPENTPAAQSPSPTPEATPEGSLVRLGVLTGPTGMGAAKLLSDNKAGESVNQYEVTVASSPTDEIVPMLNNGELDIAAVPTNLAANLYNKTDGVRLLALNTLGVLHILEIGESVSTMADLEGRTIYATGEGSNPEYVLDYLLTKNGLDPDNDVDIQWLASEELTARMAAGEIDLAMLPVPAATTVMMQNSDVRDAIDLNDAWEQAGAGGTFTMGCVVARTQFLEENPEAVDAFLKEYQASIQYANENVEEAAGMMEEFGIVPKAAVAQAAIPQANMVYLAGEDLKGISDYYQVLFAADPTSIGGAIPDDNFYYIP